MQDKKYPQTMNQQSDMVSEPWRDYEDFTTDEINDTVAIDEEDSEDWNDEWDELSQMAIKASIEQMERGEGYSWDEVMKDIKEELGLQL